MDFHLHTGDSFSSSSLSSENNLQKYIDADGHIVVTFINAGYFDYLLNLWQNIKRTDIPWTLCTFCTDEEAHLKCEEANIPSVRFYAEPQRDPTSEYSSWNDKNWNRIQFTKLDIIRSLINIPIVRSITYLDGDIHIYRDFVPYLKTLRAQFPDIRLFIQSDHNVADVRQFGRELCGGFFHVVLPDSVAGRQTAPICRLFEYTDEDVAKNTFNADQQHINAKVAEYGIPTKQLDRSLFPNGIFIKQQNSGGVGGEGEKGIPKGAHLIHYNYLVGAEKKRVMAQNGHWYLTYLNILHHKTATVYPPFKNGLYLEEYFSRHNTVRNNKYIDVHWTNLQIEPRFRQIQPLVQKLVDELYPAINLNPSSLNQTKYFTIVQHDDGVMFRLPPNTTVYNAGGNGNVVNSWTVPIPLIYEDRLRRLESVPKLDFNDKPILCSFVGSMTHPVRNAIQQMFGRTSGFEIHFTEKWTDIISEEKQLKFAEITQRSKFCLAPRGYGRTSFRFYEAFLLGAVPIYVWDDVEWLPYKDPKFGRTLDYSEFAISINVRDLSKLESRLRAIDETTYNRMLFAYGQKARHMFTMEGVKQYIVDRETNQ